MRLWKIKEGGWIKKRKRRKNKQKYKSIKSQLKGQSGTGSNWNRGWGVDAMNEAKEVEKLGLSTASTAATLWPTAGWRMQTATTVERERGGGSQLTQRQPPCWRWLAHAHTRTCTINHQNDNHDLGSNHGTYVLLLCVCVCELYVSAEVKINPEYLSLCFTF